ncbi:JAB domain-containing protein [Flavivirga amylovorans]|uniref:JAB domain-containing protein n=1 Tax=Flavivirga amylovorans TaxID=870486 RepID=A0ABT8WYL6_9FLAO|nr:JAB domain-containing protein [Flavivirga amylovorans]MDO5986758.1 JAB domain-containing protein [Flavivirga amylovorans]
MNVRLTKEQKVQILNSSDIYKVMQQVLLRENKIRRNQEHFWVVGLDNNNKILFIELIGLGAVNRVNANPPDVFRMGIYKLAVKMILCHNHPSGNVEASKADENFTDKMLKVGKIINIEVIEHLIISEEKYTSFVDNGIINKLQKSRALEIEEKEKENLKTWNLEIKLEETAKMRDIEIAKSLKKSGMPEKDIKKHTGLSDRDMEVL